MATKIIDKIRKLLALAGNNTSDEEAKAALLKAQQLMAENSIEEKDLNLEEKKSRNLVRKVFHEYGFTYSRNMWISYLAAAIAENFKCGSALTHPYGTKTYYPILTGFEEDVELAGITFGYAISFLHTKEREILREVWRTGDSERLARQRFNAYGEGFVAGLRAAFAEQLKEHEEWGLVLVKPQEVKDWEKNLVKNHIGEGSTCPTSHYGYGDYDSGYQEGKKFTTRDKLQSGAASLGA